MRKKIMFGMIALLALVAALGERYFNRAVGQDVPLPKAPSADKPAEINQLFDSIKKDLEKKDAPTFPALPALKKDESTAPPTLPSLPVSKDEKVLITPPSPMGDAPKLVPPVGSDKPSGIPGYSRSTTLSASDQPPDASKNVQSNLNSKLTDVGDKQKDEKVLLAPPPMGDAPKPTLPRVVSEKPVETPKQAVTLPPLDAKSLPATIPPLAPLQEPAKLDAIKPAPAGSSNVTLPDVKTNTAPQAVTLPKNSPWSLNVVMVDGQTIVTAVVNKKHEFKILCQTLDLQTGKGMLKASGKVQINGDAFHGTCDHLSITLMEDRLLLEGKALVSIDRTSANVSDATPASFELKGETLNLRISELATSSVYDFRAVSNHEPHGRVVTASLKLEGTQWTPYGRLRAVKSNENMWSLEGSNGAIIAYVLAREGGSLERYVGQNISVYGTREREHGGQPVLRVTHIALP